MADEQDPRGPSLEPPSLFRRKRKDEPASSVTHVSPTTILDDITAVETTRSRVPGRVGAVLAGVLVGALIVALTSASFELCSRIRGTSSCGGLGFFLLVAILVLAVVLGAAVLRLCEVADPGSTSFLAVGLTSVIALLFLIDALFQWWMVIAIPLVSVLTFLLSHWVTTTFVEPAKD